MYDIAIIGGGPAGLTAAIYAIRYKLKAVTISPEYGGKINHAHSIENWPGEKSITGSELSEKLYDHAKHVKAELVDDYVQSIEKKTNFFHITTNKNVYDAKRIIFTVGTQKEKLGIPGEEKYFGKGVSYSTAVDGPKYKNKNVIVVGSGDSACTSAVFMANIAKMVYLMYRSNSLKAEPIWIDQVNNNPKIEIMPTIMPNEIIGDTKVKRVICSDKSTLDVDGIFIEVGSTPSEFLINELGLKTDETGYVIVDNNQKTNVKNVWAAGDITTNSGKFKQIITSAAEGAVAVSSIYTETKS